MDIEMLGRGVSRRQLARAVAMASAGAGLFNEFAMAQQAERRVARGPMPKDAVRISSNENPLGPCPEALQAISEVAKFGGRYSPHGEQGEFVKVASAIEGVPADHVSPFAGSSDPLFRATLAFTAGGKSYVMGDPGYEAGARAAAFVGAKVHRIPLKSDFSHDVEAMANADSNAGLIYICNPNNPTGTVTKREQIEWLVKNKPKGSVLLIDEAYIHFSEETPCSDLVKKGEDVVVLRTFSKAYGMAGIRAGMAIARPDLQEKMRPYGSGMLPITGLAAATASMKASTLMAERRKINAVIRDETLEFLDKNKFSYVPSVSNKFMIDVKRPGMEVVSAMADKHVYIGRVWPAWPTHVRVSVGTKDDMAKFQKAFLQVMA